MIRFEDVGSRAFVVVKEKKSGKELALLAPAATKRNDGERSKRPAGPPIG
jgi:hypothetical protein